MLHIATFTYLSSMNINALKNMLQNGIKTLLLYNIQDNDCVFPTIMCVPKQKWGKSIANT